jgi:hypothetical protein
MYRHVRQNCKIANSEDGMDKLIEHTLQRQLTEQNTKIDAQSTQIAELAVLLKNQLALYPQSVTLVTQNASGAATINNAPVTNVAQTNIVLNAWDGERRISVDATHIIAAFAQNARLREYMKLSDHELTDPEIAPPYVTDLFMDLVKRGHVDPAARNVYLNPRRADQALVHLKSGRWEVLPLQEATRLMFDGVAGVIHRVTLSYDERKQLPLEAQNALSISGLMYDDEPDEYAKRAKAPMAAHLQNTAPVLTER